MMDAPHWWTLDALVGPCATLHSAMDEVASEAPPTSTEESSSDSDEPPGLEYCGCRKTLFIMYRPPYAVGVEKHSTSQQGPPSARVSSPEREIVLLRCSLSTNSNSLCILCCMIWDTRGSGDTVLLAAALCLG